MTYFQYEVNDKRREVKLTPLRESREAESENLTGIIQGQPADSQDEERFARSFYKTGHKFQYQVPVDTVATMPGQEKRVDFIVDTFQPFEPRGYISHYFAISQVSHDLIREHLLNEVFDRAGLRRLKVAKYYQYAGGQPRVDAYVRRNF